MPLQAPELQIALQSWLARDPDPDTRAELARLIRLQKTEEIARRFAGRLQFGTAGLRGLVGVGSARMNRLVVRETSAGLARYLLAQIKDAAARGVFVTYDGRHDSRRFAEDVAGVFAALGFQVYFTLEAAATPLGAFGVLQRGAAAGIVVTASHNPREYNGYKVYWQNGAQIIPPHDTCIAAAIERAATEDIPCKAFDLAAREGQIIILGEEFTRAYCEAVIGGSLFQHRLKAEAVGIAYTALHGVGADIAERLLREAGVKQFIAVASQCKPDGDFPTVDIPNPEEAGAMDAVMALAKQTGATLACANDPDADRLAVAARDAAGEYRMLSGDQVGVLLGHFLLQQGHAFTPIVCTTIVSSLMLKQIAEEAGALFLETLTGFKWLINTALQHEDDAHQFIFAYEEALGYATGSQVRDKDGLSSLLAFVQMTAQLAAAGKSVFDQLELLYRRYGLHATAQRSLALNPESRSLSRLLRDSQPAGIAGLTVHATEDLLYGMRQYADGRCEKLELPCSDALVYRLSGGGRVIVRPSGTEPKLKCYYELVQRVDAAEPFSEAQQRIEDSLSTLIARHQDWLADVLASEQAASCQDAR